jgi:hypothetical protein
MLFKPGIYCAGRVSATGLAQGKGGDDAFAPSPTAVRSLRALAVCAVKLVEAGLHRRHLGAHGDQLL